MAVHQKNNSCPIWCLTLCLQAFFPVFDFLYPASSASESRTHAFTEHPHFSNQGVFVNTLNQEFYIQGFYQSLSNIHSTLGLMILKQMGMRLALTHQEAQWLLSASPVSSGTIALASDTYQWLTAFWKDSYIQRIPLLTDHPAVARHLLVNFVINHFEQTAYWEIYQRYPVQSWPDTEELDDINDALLNLYTMMRVHKFNAIRLGWKESGQWAFSLGTFPDVYMSGVPGQVQVESSLEMILFRGETDTSPVISLLAPDLLNHIVQCVREKAGSECLTTVDPTNFSELQGQYSSILSFSDDAKNHLIWLKDRHWFYWMDQTVLLIRRGNPGQLLQDYDLAGRAVAEYQQAPTVISYGLTQHIQSELMEEVVGKSLPDSEFILGLAESGQGAKIAAADGMPDISRSPFHEQHNEPEDHSGSENNGGRQSSDSSSSSSSDESSDAESSDSSVGAGNPSSSDRNRGASGGGGGSGDKPVNTLRVFIENVHRSGASRKRLRVKDALPQAKRLHLDPEAKEVTELELKLQLLEKNLVPMQPDVSAQDFWTVLTDALGFRCLAENKNEYKDSELADLISGVSVSVRDSHDENIYRYLIDRETQGFLDGETIDRTDHLDRVMFLLFNVVIRHWKTDSKTPHQLSYAEQKKLISIRSETDLSQFNLEHLESEYIDILDTDSGFSSWHSAQMLEKLHQQIAERGEGLDYSRRILECGERTKREVRQELYEKILGLEQQAAEASEQWNNVERDHHNAVSAKNKIIKKKTRELAKLEKDQEHIAAQLADTADAFSSKAQAYDRLSTQHERLKQKSSQQEEVIKNKCEKVGELKARCQKLSRQLKNFPSAQKEWQLLLTKSKAQLSEATIERDRVLLEKETLQSELSSVEGLLSNSRQEVDGLKEELTSHLTEELDQLKKKSHGQESKLANLKKQWEKKTIEADKKGRELATERQERDKIQTEYEEVNNKWKVAVDSLGNSQKTKTHLETELREYSNKLSKLETKSKEQLEKLKEFGLLKEEALQRESQLTALKIQLGQKEDEVNEVSRMLSVEIKNRDQLRTEYHTDQEQWQETVDTLTRSLQASKNQYERLAEEMGSFEDGWNRERTGFQNEIVQEKQRSDHIAEEFSAQQKALESKIAQQDAEIKTLTSLEDEAHRLSRVYGFGRPEEEATSSSMVASSLPGSMEALSVFSNLASNYPEFVTLVKALDDGLRNSRPIPLRSSLISGSDQQIIIRQHTDQMEADSSTVQQDTFEPGLITQHLSQLSDWENPDDAGRSIYFMPDQGDRGAGLDIEDGAEAPLHNRERTDLQTETDATQQAVRTNRERKGKTHKLKIQRKRKQREVISESDSEFDESPAAPIPRKKAKLLDKTSLSVIKRLKQPEVSWSLLEEGKTYPEKTVLIPEETRHAPVDMPGVFGDLSESDERLQTTFIEFLDSAENVNQTFQLKKTLINELAPIPEWSEVQEQHRREWSSALIRYGIYRLTRHEKAGVKILQAGDLSILRRKSEAYFYSLGQLMLHKAETMDVKHVAKEAVKKGLLPPIAKVFRLEEGSLNTGHMYFYQWYFDREHFSHQTYTMMSTLNVMEPGTIEMSELGAEYVLRYMDLFPPKRHKITLNDETKRWLAITAGYFKDRRKLPVPREVGEQYFAFDEWGQNVLEHFLVASGVPVEAEFSSNPGVLKALATTSGATGEQYAMDLAHFVKGNILNFAGAVSKKTTSWKNPPIEGTTVDKDTANTANILLSYVHHYGFSEIPAYLVQPYVGTMLKMFKPVSSGSSLEPLYNQLLTLKVNGISNPRKVVDYLKNLENYPHKNKINHQNYQEHLKDFSAVKMKDFTVTTDSTKRPPPRPIAAKKKHPKPAGKEKKKKQKT